MYQEIPRRVVDRFDDRIQAIYDKLSAVMAAQPKVKDNKTSFTFRWRMTLPEMLTELRQATGRALKQLKEPNCRIYVTKYKGKEGIVFSLTVNVPK